MIVFYQKLAKNTLSTFCIQISNFSIILKEVFLKLMDQGISRNNNNNFIMSEIEQSKINSPKKVKGFHETLMRRFSSIMNHHSRGNSSSRVH
jgi:hypothetical protein